MYACFPYLEGDCGEGGRLAHRLPAVSPRRHTRTRRTRVELLTHSAVFWVEFLVGILSFSPSELMSPLAEIPPGPRTNKADTRLPILASTKLGPQSSPSLRVLCVIAYRLTVLPRSVHGRVSLGRRTPEGGVKGEAREATGAEKAPRSGGQNLRSPGASTAN